MIRKSIMSLTRNCYLQNLKDPNSKINLLDGKTVYLGRNEQTMLADLTLSRKQVAAIADYNRNTVDIQILGVNTSGCNGYALRKSGKYHLKHGDSLELLLGTHVFLVEFDPPPHYKPQLEQTAEPEAKVAKVNFPIFNPTILDLNSTKKMGDGSWESIDNGDLLIYSCTGLKSQSKVAAFDMDGTLIRTKSGARFPKDADDWTFNFPDLTKQLNDLYQDDYKLVVFTNQAGVKHDPSSVKNMKHKIHNIMSKINVPMQVFVATTRSIYRKPAPGMWSAFHKEKNDRIEVDHLNSFYVGDAAGREKNWAPKKSKDHSMSDRLFAINLNLKFYTPEEYFLGAKCAPFKMPLFDPRSVPDPTNSEPQVGNVNELIVMVGSPGSGKSVYCQEHLISNGYAYANRDKLGSWQACSKLVEKALQNRQSAVVDNTNGDKNSRKRFVDVAKKYNIRCRCFSMTTSWPHCKHNNRFRELTDKGHVSVADVILNSYKKKFEEPSLEEGFDEVVKVDFVPKFNNKEHEELYKMFLLES